MGQTTIHSIPFPEGTDAPQGDVQMEAMANSIDAKLSPFASGVYASRPAASGVVRFYFATDRAILYVSDGTSWHPLDGAAVGEVRAFAGAIPTNWLACDGSTKSRTAYPDLNAYLSAQGYPYGNGDGSTTFTLPDYRGRVVIGAGGGYALGQKGGAESVVLSQGQLPAHAHSDGTYKAADHQHFFSGITSIQGDHQHNVIDAPGAGMGYQSGSDFRRRLAVGTDGDRGDASRLVTDGAGGHQHTYSGNTSLTGPDVTGQSGSVGSGEAHENRPPFQVVNVAIKAV